MHAKADKKGITRNDHVPAAQHGTPKPNAGLPFSDNRPVAIQMKQLQEMADQYTAQHKPVATVGVLQRKFTFPQAADANLVTTALYRLRQANNPLIKEVNDKNEWDVNIQYTDGPFTASPKREIGEPVKVDLAIPGKDDDKGADIRQKNETSTYHEMVHARAIFNDEFNLAPMVYHTVMVDGAFHGREAIPLEEALTVGFVDTEHETHSLHTTTDMKNLAAFSDRDWDAFAPKMKNRYKRIYGGEAAAGQSGATENKQRAGEKRKFYEAGSVGKDEAWEGDGLEGSHGIIKSGHKKPIEERKKEVDELKKWYDTYAAVSWVELMTKLQDKLSDNEDQAHVLELARTINQEGWTAKKLDFTTKYTELYALYPELKVGGDFKKWGIFKEKADKFKETTKDIAKILFGLNLADNPIDMDNLFG